MADVKTAELLTKGESDRIRVALLADGRINSCSLDSAGNQMCCFTSEPTQDAEYYAYLEYLKGAGYSASPLEPQGLQVNTECTECARTQEAFQKWRERLGRN